MYNVCNCINSNVTMTDNDVLHKGSSHLHTHINKSYKTKTNIQIPVTTYVESYHMRLKTKSCRFNIILILFYNNTTAYSG